MTSFAIRAWRRCLLALTAIALCCTTACGTSEPAQQDASATSAPDTAGYIVSPLDEPDTCDFQCTTINYTVALNVFDRLVETVVDRSTGETGIRPSLAESWEVSDDGLTYTFYLRDGITFSNGSPLTASDVYYTFVRMLTHPDACNQDIASEIVGAKRLMAGDAQTLEGFDVVDDLTFQIELEQPFSAFLACLCMPGASILDEQSTEEAGALFGKDPASTIGTGPFVFEAWRPGDRMLLAANPDCWEGPPACAGVDLRFVVDPETLDRMVRNEEIDIVNVDDLGDAGEYYLHGNAYASRLREAPHVGIDYIALNESVKPLDDVRVRKALQLALDRGALLDAALGGSGVVENGIFPHGLIGFNPDLPAIAHDPAQAKELLKEAGHEDGFDLEVGMRASSLAWQRQLMEMAATMWGDIGVRAHITLLEDEEFMSKRTSGDLACYTASWAADYNDPDNFIYTFFGNRENTTFRSLCYGREEVMDRVSKARAITDDEVRIAEYRDLERQIVQEDAAWIPLFSRMRHFLVSDRLGSFTTAWNGWFETSFKYMSVLGQ